MFTKTYLLMNIYEVLIIYTGNYSRCDKYINEIKLESRQTTNL